MVDPGSVGRGHRKRGLSAKAREQQATGDELLKEREESRKRRVAKSASDTAANKKKPPESASGASEDNAEVQEKNSPFPLAVSTPPSLASPHSPSGQPCLPAALLRSPPPSPSDTHAGQPSFPLCPPIIPPFASSDDAESHPADDDMISAITTQTSADAAMGPDHLDTEECNCGCGLNTVSAREQSGNGTRARSVWTTKIQSDTDVKKWATLCKFGRGINCNLCATLVKMRRYFLLP